MIDTEKHVSTPRMKRFLKHLGKASEKRHEEKKIDARRQFVEKIDSLSDEPSSLHEDFLKADAKTIESQIKKALDIEKRLFERQQKDEAELSQTQHVIDNEHESIERLRDDLRHVQHQVVSTQQADEQMIHQNDDRISRITEMMAQLSAKVDELSGIKSSAEDRLREMEEKVSQTVAREAETEAKLAEKKEPTVFLVKEKDVPVKVKPKKVEKEDKVSKRELKTYLKGLEAHHKKMVKAGFHSKGDLGKLKRKITSLKKKLK